MDAVNTKTVQQLKQNIYRFSAAKTYQQLQKFNTYLTDENGKERSFNDFKKLVLEKHPTYNVNYLQAEYQTAKASAQMAAKWQQFQRNKSRYPNLRYKTVGDEHVRDEHRTLDGFCAAIDDKIWDRIYPPNDWRCRCYVQQTNSPVSKEKPDISFMKPEFSLNVGKTGVVFNEEAHPYYIMPSRDEKAVKVAFESFKLQAGYGKAKYNSNSGGKVFVSDFADPLDLFNNFSVAKVMADKGMTVKIRPDINANVIKGFKNPEYLIGKSPADLKQIQTFANLSRVISDTKKQCMNKKVNADQKPFSIVFDISSIKKPNFKDLQTQLNRSIHSNRGKTIKQVIVVYKDKVAILSRADIVKRDYSKLLKIQ